MVVGVVVAGSGLADTVVTTTTGAWDGPVWTPHAPNAGDVAVLKHSLTLSNATVSLAACTNTAGTTLTFGTTNAVLNATVVWVDGTLTHNVESAMTTNALGQWIKDNWISIACTDCTISASGKIDVSAKGYQAPNTGTLSGYGPGGGITTSFGPWGGAGHGGIGGSTKGGGVYDSADSPSEPGSGGASLNSNEVWNAGGNGGGLVQIAATGKVTVNGSILANGGSGGSSRGGGGSGGGIWVVCSTLAGSGGAVAANGGDGPGSVTVDGGGGGGRIRIQYDPVAQSNLLVKPSLMTISARGGGGVSQASGRPGTVSMPDNTVLASGFFQGGQILGFNGWTMPSVTLSSNDAVAVFTNGFQLTVTGDLLCSGARSGIEMSNGVLNVGGSLLITNGGNGLFYNCAVTISSNLGLGFGTFTTFAADTNGATLRVGGNLTANSDILYSYCSPTNIFTANIGGIALLTNSSKWYVYSAMTNSGMPYYGALVSVGGNFVLTTNCWVYPCSHTTNGGSPTFRMKNLTISTNAGFDASGKGYAVNPTTSGYGFGPGAGRSSGNDCSGAGHGGIGGRSTTYAGGTNYDSVMYPSCAGSAGGNATATAETWNLGGNGGGLVRIEAASGTVTLNGTIKVDGSSGGTSRGGGGAGGGIYLVCKHFAGLNGFLSAVGGNGPGTQGGVNQGGGGGGRIAVWRMIDESSGISSNIAGGTTTNSAPSGQAGTFYWGSIPSQGLLFLVR